MQGIVKLCIHAALLISGIIQITSFETWWFIQNVNLIFHEAGHVFLMFFGQFIAIAGGTIFEVLIPSIVTLYFVRRYDWFAASCTSWWLMTALLSVSIYATDAQERALPLITKDISTHDWFNMLSQLNLLPYDNVIGFMIYLLSISSLALSSWLLLKDDAVRKIIQR